MTASAHVTYSLVITVLKAFITILTSVSTSIAPMVLCLCSTVCVIVTLLCLQALLQWFCACVQRYVLLLHFCVYKHCSNGSVPVSNGMCYCYTSVSTITAPVVLCLCPTVCVIVTLLCLQALLQWFCACVQRYVLLLHFCVYKHCSNGSVPVSNGMCYCYTRRLVATLCNVSFNCQHNWHASESCFMTICML